MISRTEALKALDAVLRGITPSWETAYPGVSYTPKAGTPYQRGRITAWKPGTQHWGKGVYTYINGIYQADVNYPAKEKQSESAEVRAQLIVDTFFPERVKIAFTQGATSVFVSRLPETGPLIEGEVHILIPVLVHFTVHDRPPNP